MTELNFVDITHAQVQKTDDTADVYHKSYITTSYKPKHLDIICSQIS